MDDKIIAALKAATQADGLSTREIFRWVAIARDELGITDLTEGNLAQVISHAAELYKQDVWRTNARHDYFTESKRLPYDRFVQAIKLEREGFSLDRIQRETGVNKNTLSAYRRFWKENRDHLDPDNFRAIYRAFLSRNLLKKQSLLRAPPGG